MMILSSCGSAEFQDVSADVKSESVSEECFTNPLSYIGKIHNDALDVISMTDVTIDSICDFAHNYVEVSFSVSPNEMPIMSDFTVHSLKIAKDIGIQRFISYRSRMMSQSDTADSLYCEIPKAYKKYIDDMKLVVYGNETDSVVIARRFAMIDLSISIDTCLSEEEKNGLWACSAITYAS